MEPTNFKDWKKFKQNLKDNIDRLMEQDTVDTEVLELMSHMLEHSRIRSSKNTLEE